MHVRPDPLTGDEPWHHLVGHIMFPASILLLPIAYFEPWLYGLLLVLIFCLHLFMWQVSRKGGPILPSTQRTQRQAELIATLSVISARFEEANRVLDPDYVPPFQIYKGPSW